MDSRLKAWNDRGWRYAAAKQALDISDGAGSFPMPVIAPARWRLIRFAECAFGANAPTTAGGCGVGARLRM